MAFQWFAGVSVVSRPVSHAGSGRLLRRWFAAPEVLGQWLSDHVDFGVQLWCVARVSWAQPWRCLWRGLEQITMTRPWRRITWHLSQIFLTLGLTFM